MHVSPVPNTARTLQSGYAATRSKTKPENALRAEPAPARRTRGCLPGHRKSVPGSAGPAHPGARRKAREPREAAPPLPEPREPPDRRAALPSPTLGPGPLLPRVAAGRGRRETPPAGHPLPRAPRRPSGPGRAVIGRIPTPRCREEPRSTPSPVSRRPQRENGGPGPGTHLAPRRPGKGRALARAAQIAARDGAGPAHPGEARAGRRAGRALRTHRESGAAKPERTFRVLARGGGARAGTCAVLRSAASGGREGEGNEVCSAVPLAVTPSLRRGPPCRTSHRWNSRPLVSKCRSHEVPPESRPWHRGALGLRSPRGKRGSACAAELPLPPSPPVPPARALQDGSSHRSNSGRVDGVFPCSLRFIIPH